MAQKKKEVSDSRIFPAIILNIFFGWMGGHRIYTGQTFSAIAMMFTMGGFGIVWFIDFMSLLFGNYKDGKGRPVTAWV